MENIDLSAFFQTKTQANDFSASLAAISDQTYQTNFNLEKALTDQLSIEKKDLFIALIRDNHIPVTSPSDIKAFLDKLQEKIAALPLLPLTLAFEPKQQILKALSDWFLLNTTKQVLFDITVDRSLIAGAIITFNGKQGDFSIKPKFDQIVKKVLTNHTTPAATPPAEHQSLEGLHLGR